MMTVVGAQWMAARAPDASKAGTTWASKAPRTTRAHFSRVAFCSSAMPNSIIPSEKPPA